MLRKIILSVLSAIFLSISFQSYNLSFFIWFGLIPLFFALEGLSSKEAFKISFLCGFFFFILSMYWLIYVTATGWIVLSLYQALYFGLFGLFFVFSKRYTLSAPRFYSGQAKRYILIPALWCILEYLRSRIGGGIGWNLLAYSQYKNLPIIQISDLTGAYGVSFLIVLVNFTIYNAIKMAIGCCKKDKKFFVRSHLSFREELRVNPLLQTVSVLLIITGALFYGYSKIDAFNKDTLKEAKLKVSIIQGNIEQTHKWDNRYKDNILKIYESLTKEALKEKPDLIIWPETSLPGYFNIDRSLSDYMKKLTAIIKRPILVGSPTTAIIDNKDLGDYNSALLFSRKGKLIEQYNKLHLVLLGEFVPFGKYFPWLRKLLPITGNFIPGDEHTVFKLRTMNNELQTTFGTLICFEDIFPNLSRRFVKNGAEFMVNITNDAWFKESSAPYQHGANSVFRAVENRRGFIRCANTGLSCFIDKTGKIYNRVRSNSKDIFIQGYLTDYIAVDKTKTYTFYTRYGDIFIFSCMFMVCLFMIDYIRKYRYNK